MILRLSVFLLLVAFLASVGCGSGAGDNIGQGLFVDGPGGYLPDGGYLNSDTNSNVAFDSGMVFDRGMAFDPKPLMNYDGFTPFLPKINYDIWAILSNWDDLFYARDFSFFPANF